MAEMRPVAKDLYHVGMAIVLVLAILGLLTWSGIISCRDVPGFCSVYYAIKGPPKTLIVFGETGLGNPALLAQELRNRSGAAATNISQQDVEFVSAGNLKQFDLVVVTRARKIPTRTLKAFMEYVDGGGRLVWTGDAGIELSRDDQFLYANDVDANAPRRLISPWARKDVTEQEAIRFDRYISVNYINNYCNVRACVGEQQVGPLVPEAGADHKLIYGISNNLKLYGDFALVEDQGIGSTRVLSVDTQTNLIEKNAFDNNSSRDIGKVFPIIVTSGIGEKITYYAIPPEILAQPPMQYKLFVENLYDGILR